MANYPPFYGPQFPQYPQGYGQQPATPGINARLVSCREEAVAAQISFDNTPNIFADLSHGMIYVKRFNPGTGCADLLDYKFTPPAPPAQPAHVGNYATAEQLSELAQRIDRLEARTNDAEQRQPVYANPERSAPRRRPDAGAVQPSGDRPANGAGDQYGPRQDA